MATSKIISLSGAIRVSPISTPLSLTLPKTSSYGSSRKPNTATDSFVLVDLFKQVNNMSTALGELKCPHRMADTGIKHLKVMEECLKLIYSVDMK